MQKYEIKQVNKDFSFYDDFVNIKGTRRKRLITDNNNEIAIFKYEGENYECSEACSEKLSYEIAKVLGYKVAKIELAKDENDNIGVLNYIFSSKKIKEHTDAIDYLNINNEERKKYYTIANIKNRLDKLDVFLFKDFIKIMIFDALVGEQDRHEENWGITKQNDKYEISPLYDNGCNLLRAFKCEEYAEKYYNKIRDFDALIRKSTCIIYREDGKRYKHFELIEELNKKYPNEIKYEIDNLNKLTDNIIEDLVNKIPNDLLTTKHKEYIIIYLRKRRDILLDII